MDLLVAFLFFTIALLIAGYYVWSVPQQQASDRIPIEPDIANVRRQRRWPGGRSCEQGEVPEPDGGKGHGEDKTQSVNKIEYAETDTGAQSGWARRG